MLLGHDNIPVWWAFIFFVHIIWKHESSIVLLCPGSYNLQWQNLNLSQGPLTLLCQYTPRSLEINHIKCITFLLPVFCSALNIYILEADILFFLSPVRILCGHVHSILWVIIFLPRKPMSTAPKPTAILGLCFCPIYRPLLWKLDE